MKNLSKNFQKIVTSLVLLITVLVQLPSAALAFEPTEPPEPPFSQGLEFNIAKEAYDQRLPTANSYSPSSDIFKQRFADLIGSILTIVITIGALMLLIYLMWGAFSWITSSGDKSKLEEARNRMTTAVIGMIVLSSVVAIFMFIQQILGICVLDFWGTACVAPPAPLP